MRDAIAKQDMQTPINRAGGLSKFLLFALGEDTYAVNIHRVKEIIELGAITAVPMMPDFIRGALNLRGRVVPVIDLSVRLGVSRATESGRSCIVIIEVDGGREPFDVGLVVDAVRSVRDINPHDIEPAPSFGGKIRTDFIEGMGKVDADRFIVVLAIERILSMDDLDALSRARGGTEPAELAT